MRTCRAQPGSATNAQAAPCAALPLPSVEALGRRHAGYGVTDEHYATVGAALLWTLQQGLGEQFTTEVEAAWTTAYALLADTMQAAARQEEVAYAQ